MVLQADGTNWFIVAGEPKRVAAYSSQTEAFSGIPSTTRPAYVSLEVFNEASFYAINVYVGAQKIGRLKGSSSASSLGFYVPPGVEWKVAEGEGAFSCLHSTVIL